MNRAQAEEVIIQHWNTQWAALHAALAVPEVPPVWTQDNKADNTLAEFVRISVIPTVRRNRSLGGERKEQRGFISVQVHTRAGNGRFRSNTLVDRVHEVFENKSIYVSGVSEPVSVYVGDPSRPSSDPPWQIDLVTLRFVYLDA